MVKITENDAFGFEIDDHEKNMVRLGLEINEEIDVRIENSVDYKFRIYNLHHNQSILAEKDGNVIASDLACASNHDKEDHESFFRILDKAISLDLELVIAIDKDFGKTKSAKDAEKSLKKKFKEYRKLVKREFRKYFDGKFDEPEFVTLLTECHTPERFGSFLEKILIINEGEAKLSLKGKKPNYCLNTPYLFENIANYTGKKIEYNGIPIVIEGFSESKFGNPLLMLGELNYESAIVQRNSSSFTFDEAMQRKAKEITNGLDDDMGKAYEIFRWIRQNIIYGEGKKEKGTTYRGALAVYNSLEGVCGESAALQVTMERLVGNMAFLVQVSLPEVGDRHACAAHLRPNGQIILIDTTTNYGFNIKYNNFKILSDEHSFAKP